MKNLNRASTGLDSLDTVIDHLRIGDNVVWQVDDIAGYAAMVMPFVERSLQNGHQVNYMRFAQHEPLLEPRQGLTIHRINSAEGFESFATRIHAIITREGTGRVLCVRLSVGPAPGMGLRPHDRQFLHDHLPVSF